MWQYFAIIAMIGAGIILYDFGATSYASVASTSPLRSAGAPQIKADTKIVRHIWNFYFWILIAALCLLAGLRYNIGIDTYSNQACFHEFPKLKDFSLEMLRYGVGGRFNIVKSLLATAGLGLWPWQTLCAVILNVSVAVSILRYVRYRYVAIACWIIFGYIILNFETMLAGVAAGFLLLGLPDIQNRRYGHFYLKLLLGVFFHLSVLFFVWLPLLNQRVRRKHLSPVYTVLLLLLLSPIMALAFKWIILAGSHFIDRIPGLNSLGYHSGLIDMYADTMLQSEALNWKGYLGIGFCNILLPLWAAQLLLRNGNKGSKSNRIFGIVLIIYAILETMRFEVILFGRFSMLLLPAVAIGLALALEECRTKLMQSLWWGGVAIAAVLAVRTLFSPMPLTGEGKRIEIYYPYTSWIDKGVVYRRAWLMVGYFCKYNPDDQREVSIYDSTFDLKPGEHEIISPFYPEQTHENMERIRSQMCPKDTLVRPIPPGVTYQP